MADRARTYLRVEASRIKSINDRNWRTFKQKPWQEVSGAFGDLGTFVPIFVALAARRDTISVSSTLVFSGIANILTGVFFGIPLPVQPMKAIAAVAIANQTGFGAAELASAGIFVASCVTLLSITGLLHAFTRMIPVPVVKGIQVGAGLTLAMKAIPMLAPGTSFPDSLVEIVPTAIFVTLLLYVSVFPRFPLTLWAVGAFAILAILAGIVNAIMADYIPSGYPWFSLWNPFPLLIPTDTQFVRGALEAGLGQLPLTTLNSIVAVVYLAEDLFPDLKAPTATTIGMSVALMNLIGCWFRAMPVCHGSGGLAAQYRFGARSGASVIFLGTLKLILGLFGSEFALWFCQEFPKIILALLLFLAGLELVKMGESLNSEQARDLWEDSDEESVTDAGATGRRFKKLNQEQKMRRWTVMCATVIALLGAKNDGVGFIVGMIMHGVYNAKDYYLTRWQQRDGQIRIGEENEAAATEIAEPQD